MSPERLEIRSSSSIMVSKPTNAERGNSCFAVNVMLLTPKLVSKFKMDARPFGTSLLYIQIITLRIVIT